MCLCMYVCMCVCVSVCARARAFLYVIDIVDPPWANGAGLRVMKLKPSKLVSWVKILYKQE